jgi:hypothetical protein
MNWADCGDDDEVAAAYPVSVAEIVEGKRVTWAEGFFDLVVVLAVTQVATLLGEHHRWGAGSRVRRSGSRLSHVGPDIAAEQPAWA